MSMPFDVFLGREMPDRCIHLRACEIKCIKYENATHNTNLPIYANEVLKFTFVRINHILCLIIKHRVSLNVFFRPFEIIIQQHEMEAPG